MTHSKFSLNLGQGAWGSASPQPVLPAWAKKMKQQQLVDIGNQFRSSDDEDNTPECINLGDLQVGDRRAIEASTFFDYFSQEPEMYWRLHAVCEDYGSVRPVRHDVDSFYRSFAFGFLEVMSKNRHEAAAAGLLIRYAQMNSDHVTKAVRPKFVAASELSLDFVVGLEYGDLHLDDIVELLNDKEKSDLIVWFLRWLASNHIQKERERYQPIMDYLGYDLESYCKNKVDSPGQTADPIQVMALTAAVGMSIRVEYVEDDVEDTPEDEQLRKSQAQPPEWIPPFCLLSYYGHYDVLYRRDVRVDGHFDPN